MIQKNDQFAEPAGIVKVTKNYVKQETLQYKTLLKQTLVEALQLSFENHPDPELQATRVSIEYPMDERLFPQILVKFFEQSINSAGVGHEEWLPSPNDPNYEAGGPYTKFIKYYQRAYKGTIEFTILALSSVDRDKLADALIEIIAMDDVSAEGSLFYKKITESAGEVPYSEWHYIALNVDLIQPYGEQGQMAPWMVEDVLVYETSYRMPMLGNFYSYTPKEPLTGEHGYVEEVDIYPWNEFDPEWPNPETFPEGKIPTEDYIKIHKRKSIIEKEEQIKEEEEEEAVAREKEEGEEEREGSEDFPSKNLYPSKKLYPKR